MNLVSEREESGVRLLSLEASEDELGVYAEALTYLLDNCDDETLERVCGAYRDEIEEMRDNLAQLLDSRLSDYTLRELASLSVAREKPAIADVFQPNKTGNEAMFATPKYYGTPLYTLVYEKLKSVANNREIIGYDAIFEIMGLRSGNHAAKEAGQMLGEISDHTCREGKPMLSAVVVNQQEGIPGSGFFELAAKLGKFPHGASRAQKEAFWKNELKAVYSTTW